jgi:hypothetical protein
MEAQGGKKANDRRWYSGRGQNHCVIFGRFSPIDHMISTRADAFQFARSSHPRKSLGVDTERLSITRPDESAGTR